MNDFEAALLKQVKQFLWIELLEKQALLEELITDTQKKIDAHPSYQLHESLVILKQKQEVIEQVLTANTMDIFMKYFTQYLTLVPSQQE